MKLHKFKIQHNQDYDFYKCEKCNFGFWENYDSFIKQNPELNTYETITNFHRTSKPECLKTISVSHIDMDLVRRAKIKYDDIAIVINDLGCVIGIFECSLTDDEHIIKKILT